ncbi:hypothetical protein [uncultured Nocardioides sp.]|uniref:hypothetical protein n=1 Tax=uncultured Nocardioides sp. TaxID=198441 RepID=UPI00260C2671|nr:hypothetical protein [uncultured Nocardioides sp.]
MREPTEHRASTWARVLTAGLLLGALSACTDPDDGTDPPPSPAPTSTEATTGTSPDPGTEPSVDEVRATLGALAPCGLVSPGTTSASPRGPHTCEAQLGDTRVRVTVGVPLDDEARSAAEVEDVAGLTAYTVADRCRTVFPAGPAHGIAVEIGGGCGPALQEAATIVGTSLGADADARLRDPGPDSLTACGLLSATEADSSLLVDAVGTSEGLDHCEVATGAVLARTTLSLDYTPMSFDELVRRLDGDRVTLAGQDAVVVPDGQTCFVHTYLWESDAEGRGPLRTDAVVHAETCREAQRVTATVIEAAGREPAPAGSVAELLVVGAE